MEQLNKWYRFPIKITSRKLYDALEGDVPEEQWEMSYVDINIDSIVNVSPYIHAGEDTLSGTLLYTTAGENWAVQVHPKKVRKLLNYEPIKIEADEF